MSVSVCVLTFIPSPYQVELFDAVARTGLNLSVLYAERTAPERAWILPEIHHNASFLSEMSGDALRSLVDGSDLAVFTWYRNPKFRHLMRRRQNSRKPWAFWGERPGIGRLGALGTSARRALLWPLWRGDAPIWGIGNWAIERFVREFGERRRYFDVPYFSDLSRFGKAPREHFDQPLHVLYSGSLIPRKGVETLAAAWLSVAREHPNAVLSFIGDGPLRYVISKILEPVASQSRIHGFVQWKDLPTYYNNADLLCAPSVYDGWGLVVPEALAAGLPVIASCRMGSSREMLINGENGWLVEPGSVAKLAERLNESLSLDSSVLARMSASARTTASSFDLDEGCRRFTEAIHATLASYPNFKTQT